MCEKKDLLTYIKEYKIKLEKEKRFSQMIPQSKSKVLMLASKIRLCNEFIRVGEGDTPRALK
jgi:hypothetical protein